MFIGGMTLNYRIAEKLLGPTNYFELAAKTPKQEPEIFKPDCLKDGAVVTVSLSKEAIEHLRECCKQKQEEQGNVNIEETYEYMWLEASLAGKNMVRSKYLITASDDYKEMSQSLLTCYARQYEEIVEQHREGKRAIFTSDAEKGFHIMTLEEEINALNKEYAERISNLKKDAKRWMSETGPRLLTWEQNRVARLKGKVYSGIGRLNEKLKDIVELSRSEKRVERYKALCYQQLPENYQDIMYSAMNQFAEQYESQRENGYDIIGMLKNISLFGQGINSTILKRILS